MKSLPLYAACALLLLPTLRSARAAPAAKPRVALLPVTVSPAMATVVTERFRQATREGLTGAGLDVVPDAKTEATRLSTIGTCLTAVCLKKMAAALQGAHLFITRVLRNGNNYTVLCEATAPDGQIALQESISCDICTVKEAIAKAKTLAAEAGTALKKKLTAVEPRRLPPRRPPPKKRRAPPRRPPPRRPPPRRVVPKKPVRKPWIVKRRKRLYQAAWMSAGGGAASLITGIALLAIDKKPSCGRDMPRLSCKFRYRTGAAGGVFTAVGLAAGVAAGVLFYFAGKTRPTTEKSKSVRATVLPTRGGLQAHVSLRF